MRPFSLLVTVFAFAILSAPAKATPPAQALYGTINGQPVAIFAENSAMGVCLRGETQQATAWVPVFSIECGLTVAKIESHGGGAGYVTWLLPDINARLSGYFKGGTGAEAILDEALNVSFRIAGTALVPR